MISDIAGRSGSQFWLYASKLVKICSAILELLQFYAGASILGGNEAEIFIANLGGKKKKFLYKVI